VLQGKGTGDFVTFRLEPGCSAKRSSATKKSTTRDVRPHFGVDESGKGDFFGPLVIAGCYTDRGIARTFMEAGITDSKKIGSDRRIHELADLIRKTQGAMHSVVTIGPERYNALYEKFGNLNRLLAWGHARIIENLLELRSDCPRALSDQFANPSSSSARFWKRPRHHSSNAPKPSPMSPSPPPPFWRAKVITGLATPARHSRRPSRAAPPRPSRRPRANSSSARRRHPAEGRQDPLQDRLRGRPGALSSSADARFIRPSWAAAAIDRIFTNVPLQNS
jgi:hypothetical protein